jgi:hypothetical protein
MMMPTVPAACNGGVTRGQVNMVVFNVPIQILVGYRYYR